MSLQDLNPLLQVLWAEPHHTMLSGGYVFRGQLVFRQVGHNTEELAGKKHSLFMVVGVVAVPDVFGINGEHQYTIAQKPDLFSLMGDPLPTNPGQASLVLLLDSGIDQSEISLGDGLGSLLMQPIWRV